MSHTLSGSTTLVPTSGEVKSVCVFCGAGDGADPIYVQQGYGKTCKNSTPERNSPCAPF